MLRDPVVQWMKHRLENLGDSSLQFNSRELAAIDPAGSGGFQKQLDPLSTGRHLCSRI